MIGSGKEEQGLYFLDVGDKLAHHIAVSDNKAEDLHLWHRRVGYPSFSVLKHMFPSLSFNHNTLCEACELGKHFRASYVPNNNKSSIPFTLIHTDVWVRHVLLR